MNNTFLDDSTLATADATATPYALVKGLAAWWVCHLTKEASAGATDGYVYSDLDDCAYEDSNYYTRPSRHPQSTNLCNATSGNTGFINSTASNNSSEASSPVLRNPAISLGLALKILHAATAMSIALGRDSDQRASWLDRATHLAPFPAATIPDPLGPHAASVRVPLGSAPVGQGRCNSVLRAREQNARHVS